MSITLIDENTENYGSKICVLPIQTSFTSEERNNTAHIRGKQRILINVSSNFQLVYSPIANVRQLVSSID